MYTEHQSTKDGRHLKRLENTTPPLCSDLQVFLDPGGLGEVHPMVADA